VIPYLDLHIINAPYAEQIKSAMQRVVDSGWYLFGGEVAAFEREWAAYCGAQHCTACANGLDALRLVLRAWIEMGRLHRGDEVIVPANTYIASILAVSDNGLVPVPVEPDPNTFLMCAANVASAITSRTRVLLPVHLYGQLCDMDALMAVARNNDLLVLEDCAQCHGVASSYRGDAQAWSFYPGKNLGAMGDAGAVTTSDAGLAEVVRQLGYYGSVRKYVHRYKGLNSRMDELQAAVLREKLPDLDRCNHRRQEIAARYNAEISNPAVQVPLATAPHVWHIYPLLCGRRDELQQYLLDNGVQTQIHYPIPPHSQEAYAEWRSMSMPITESIAAQELSLPCHPALADADVSQIIDVINRF